MNPKSLFTPAARRLRRGLTIASLAACLAAGGALAPAPAAADAKGGTSMTHITTARGLAPVLESAGVVAYTQGTATSQVLGTSLTAADGRYLFHVPITGTSKGVAHKGSAIVLLNTATDASLVLRNPVIDLGAGTVRAGVGDGPATTVFRIPNAASLKPRTSTAPGTDTPVTVYRGARLVLAPGIAAAVTGALGLPSEALADEATFGVAEVTLY